MPVEGTTKQVEKLPKWNERQSEMAYYVILDTRRAVPVPGSTIKALGVHSTNYTFEVLPVPPRSLVPCSTK